MHGLMDYFWLFASTLWICETCIYTRGKRSLLWGLRRGKSGHQEETEPLFTPTDTMVESGAIALNRYRQHTHHTGDTAAGRDDVRHLHDEVRIVLDAASRSLVAGTQPGAAK